MIVLPAATFRFGCDYAWAPHPSGAALKDAGISFVCRYLSYDSTKNLSIAELDNLRSAGILVVLNWEAGATDMAFGRGTGVAEAEEAAALADNLGMSDAPIYFSADFDADSAQVDACIEYMSGVNSVLGGARSGVYGDYNVAHACRGADVAAFSWGTPAWAGEPASWIVDVYQYGSGSISSIGVDLDAAYGTDFGQWPRPVSPAPKKRIDEPVLQDGDTGAAVKLLQSLLNGRPIHPHLTVDGNFGANTRAAVELMQHNEHLTVDGVVGPKTWGILGNYS